MAIVAEYSDIVSINRARLQHIRDVRIEKFPRIEDLKEIEAFCSAPEPAAVLKIRGPGR